MQEYTFEKITSRSRTLKNRIMNILITLSALLALTPLILIIADAVIQGMPALSLSFLFSTPVPVGYQGGGIAPMIQGSAIMVAIASLISIPIGVTAGIFFSEWPESRISTISSFSNDVLAEFPTMVIGVFAYATVVLATGTFSALAGAIALGIIMIPVVARTAEESLKAVPNSVKEASLALGIPRWKTVIYVVMSTAKGGLITGIILSIARAAGETAPLILTAGFSNSFVSNLLNPAGSIPYLIYYYGISPYSSWHAIAWGAALILIAIMLSLSLAVRLFAKVRTGLEVA
jgi:phosphate ABC transporter, permease protein PstA